MRGRARRFHAVKTEWGFPNFISKQSLVDPSNGFIVDDKCIVGAEVFVIKSQGVIERLSLLKVGLPYERTWNIPDFSQSAIELVSEIMFPSSNWFASFDEYYGFSEFMSISDMHDPMRGYLVEDCCILKVDERLSCVFISCRY
ncbi:hypothetical protein ACJIZ3_020172 [Penstemon smallii]|uniref:MATH domain-containing protein n=1 Tax=Penstemon smallii TaxID=265156 RepID=A0ABD3SIP5_9LAMI